VVAFVPVDAHVKRRIILVENAELSLLVVAMGGLHGRNGRKRMRLEVGVVGRLEGFARMKFGRENVDGDCVIWKCDDAPIAEDKVNGGVRGKSQCGIRTAPANESRECWLEWHVPPGVKCRFLMRNVSGV
jgi:hypothetical protein